MLSRLIVLTKLTNLPLLALAVAVMLVATGCPQSQPPSPARPSAGETSTAPNDLTVLIIDEPNAGELIARQWQAESSGALKIVLMTSQELSTSNFSLPGEVDLVLYPPGLLGELEYRKKIMPLSRKVWQASEYNKEELLRIFRTSVPRHHNETWGVPLGAPMFLLVYDQSLADSLGRAMPDEWSELRDLIEQERNDPASKFRFKIPAAENWAAQVLLARAAPLIRSRGRLSTVFDRGDLQPLINQAPFIQALEDLKRFVGDDLSQLDLTPGKLFEEIMLGQTTMGLTWPTPPQLETSVESTALGIELGFSSLPGSSRWYDHKGERWIQRGSNEAREYDLVGFKGLMGSVAAGSRDAAGAFEFLAWLGNKTTSLKTLVYSVNSSPFRASHLGNPTLWCDSRVTDESARRYAEVLEKNHSQDVVFVFPRIPLREKYLAVLDANVRACLKGELDVEAALNLTAIQWDEITDQFGRPQMIQELAKDSGL